jgi:flavin-dependent dehydrogenase
VFEEEMSICPGLTHRLAEAELVSKRHVAKEFSYTTTQQSGDGWVLIGDAFGFIDPIYSSGVYFALRSGELAADAVVAGLRGNNTSAEQLGSWIEEFKEGTHLIRKLVGAYYTSDFSFGRFMKEHPEHQGNLTDLLIGRIFYDGAGRIFDDMDPALAAASQP